MMETSSNTTGCSAVGSALALGARCREFEPLHSDHNRADGKQIKFNLTISYFMIKRLL